MELVVDKRSVIGKAMKWLREAQLVPGVVYAKHISPPLIVQFNRQDFVRMYNKNGRSSPVTLKGPGIDELVLVHDIQIDPVNNFVLHVDFLWVQKDQKVTTSVSLILQWVAPVAKLGLGRIQQVKDTIQIEAKPSNLPHEIFVDISGLVSTHDVLFIKDLILSPWVEIKDDMELPIVIVASLSGTAIEEEEEKVEETSEEAEDEEETKGESKDKSNDK